ncbi:LOW QUALITY PROTEIN: transcription elongation factor SPT6-like [Uloborus diversus]|uniref:LOW QUALITY PROTEIN: transcription elongation factor SPT6-like n=1 Tax=Uloborus diversus TaxID=327109 RepID=UPI002408F22D|nr:LOW QUALITY PROTEIN: transcription elongation factor SPT6-like [Uloborus diversus]
MADFLESEAEESEDEIINRKRKISDDEEDEDEEEDDDEKLREEMKDLINDEEEEEEKDSDEEIVRKKKKRHEELDDEFEDDDYDLIEENLGVKVQRKKKFKRLKRIEDEESDDEAEDSGKGVDDREAIANELFEGDDVEGDETSRPAVEDTLGALEESEGESDESDFIVDDDGQPITKGKKKRHIKYTDAALQEAQEIFGVDFDYNDFVQEGDEYEEEEMEEEYEDEEEEEGVERPKAKKQSRKKISKKSIFDVYEPVELERSHLTDADVVIRAADIPERFQLRNVPVTEAEDDEIEEEAEWIYKQAFSMPTISIQEGEHSGSGHQPIAGRKNVSAVGKIREALKFIRNQNFEVPFIAFYRKEYVEPDLNINDLWTVYKWDEKWCQLRSRKQNLQRLFERMQQYQCDVVMADPDKPIAEDLRALDAGDIYRLKKAQNVEEVQDCYLHFMLYYGHDVPLMKEHFKKKEQKERDLNCENAENEGADADQEQESSKIKHVPHKNSYVVCKECGIDGLAKKFGLTPEQFGENLRDNYQRHEVEQYPIEPKEVASDYVSKRFPTSEDCLSAAKFMVATQISREPAVRQCVRQTYFERAKICVAPTKKGVKEIDENHPCYSMKYLKNKPVKDLRGDQFLKLSIAERDGFLKISVSMDKHTESDGHHQYLEEIKQLYERDEFSKNVQEWNVQRQKALEIALTKILYPTFQKELKLRLLSESKEGVVKACCRKLYNWLKVAPYQVDGQVEEDEDFDTREGVRILAIAYSPDREIPAFCAMIDGNGEVLEYLRLPYLLNRKNSFREKDRVLKEKDLNSLKGLISSKKPHVVAVASESRDAIMICEDVRGVINELMESEQFPPISVELVDNELGILYMNSNKGENDFRDYPPLLRQAVSIARRLQDPLMEFSQLCTPDEEILCLKYHPLQEELNKEELLNALYLEFVNRTNEVGVDFNRAIQFSHTSNLVQFICGLGPRKAAYFLKTLKTANEQLESRAKLINFCKVGPKIFINCAGFIKIDTSSLVDSTETYLEVLDGSRVHPEAYEWARKMAVDALEYDDTSDDVNPAGALEEILENPEKLKDLDLDAFAEELERQGYGNKSITLYDIRAELNHKYKDLRTPYRSPNAEEIFNMLTKEIPETFYIGKLVLVRVQNFARRKPKNDQLENANPIRNDETGLWQCPFCLKNNFPELSDVWSHFDDASCPGQAMGVRVRMDNGISGFIPTKFISDKHVVNPEDRVQQGMTLHARITKIDIERFAVDLTCRSSDLIDKNNEWRPPKDLYYDHEAEDKDHKTAEDVAKKQNRQVYLKRVIVHPAFKNVSFKEAEKFLDTMDQGDVIIRPSSKGNNHLTVTWKVTDGIHQHIDVREEGKENEFSLGHSLIIGNESFEDLDEIIARHVQPLSSYARDLLNFRYYVYADGGKKEEMEKILFEEKKKATNKIHYYVSACKQFPGKFLLSYLPRNKVRHEFITITPDGFRYRNHTFRSVNSLFRWFKEHFRDPIPGTPTALSVRTPMGQSSYIGNTPSINLANLDPQAIQRAAASMPSHMFNTLSQVAGQTPAPYQGANYAAGYSGGSYYQAAYTPSQPVATPLVTPSYHAVPTPAHSQVPTPRYSQTPQQNNWIPPAGRTPSRSTPRTAPNPSVTDWKRMAELWVKERQETIGPVQMSTPRTPLNRGSPSPMIESTPADATPLIDEF